MLPPPIKPVSFEIKRYAIPRKPIKIEAYLDLDISSSFKKIFSHIIVNTGAELTMRVTSPEETCSKAKMNDQPTVKTETNHVIAASLNAFGLKLSLTNNK